MHSMNPHDPLQEPQPKQEEATRATSLAPAVPRMLSSKAPQEPSDPLTNPYRNHVVLIGVDEAQGQAWQFRAEFYYGESGGYMLHIHRYTQQNGAWVLVGPEPMQYFEVQAEMMDYLYPTPPQEGFPHPTRPGTMREISAPPIQRYDS